MPNCSNVTESIESILGEITTIFIMGEKRLILFITSIKETVGKE
ncbi:hypothetical protein BB2000_1564 [Proteus mirabilis BB2000]|nr:hypothetical protein BB2000_1564 [Proteus mirabilis BB2000]